MIKCVNDVSNTASVARCTSQLLKIISQGKLFVEVCNIPGGVASPHLERAACREFKEAETCGTR